MIAKGKTRELSLFRLAIVNQGKLLFASVRLSGEKVKKRAEKIKHSQSLESVLWPK